MDVIIQDSDIIRLILEYLQSRKLYACAVALERESGILSKRDENFPEDVLFLRQLTLEGNWDTLISYLEPFENLKEFNARKMYYTILCQQFYETLHSIAGHPGASDNNSKLKNILNAVKPHCSKTEFEDLCQAKSQSNVFDFNVDSSRMNCFNDLVKLLAPLYEDNKFIAQNPSYQNNTLVSALMQGMFYNKCVQECFGRGQENVLNLDNQTVHSKDLFTNNLPSASLLYWIRSINSNVVFEENFSEGQTRIRCTPLQRKKFPKPMKTSLDNFNNSSAFTNDQGIPLFSDRSTNSSTSSTANRSFSPSHNNSNNNCNTVTRISSDNDVVQTNRSNGGFENPTSVNNSKASKRSLFPMNSETVPKHTVTQLDKTYIIGSAKKNDASLQHSQNTNKLSRNKSLSPRKLSTNFREDMEVVLSHDNLISPLCDLENVKGSQVSSVKNNEAAAIESNINVDDSYAEFLKEKEMLRKQKDHLLQDIEKKSKLREDIQTTMLKNNTIQQPVNQENSTESKYVALETLHDTCAIRAVSFHPSGLVYAVGSNSKTLRVCAVQQNIINKKRIEINNDYQPTPTHVLNEIQKAHKGTIYCIDWNKEGNLLLSGSNDKMIKIHSYDILSRSFTSQPTQLNFHKGIIRDAVFLNGNSAVFASAGGDATVYITDCIQQKTIHALHGHTDQILSMYSWGVNVLATASQDKTIRLWDLRVPRCSSIIGVSSSETDLPLSVCSNYDGSVLAVGHETGWISFYDLIAGKLASKQKTNSNEVRTVRFNMYVKNVLLSGSYGGEMVLTKVDQNTMTNGIYNSVTAAKINNKVIQCRWHPNSRDFAATSAGNICNYYYNHT